MLGKIIILVISKISTPQFQNVGHLTFVDCQTLESLTNLTTKTINIKIIRSTLKYIFKVYWFDTIYVAFFATNLVKLYKVSQQKLYALILERREYQITKTLPCNSFSFEKSIELSSGLIKHSMSLDHVNNRIVAKYSLCPVKIGTDLN